MGLGPVHTVPLILARERAAEARGLLLEGLDPIVSRQAAREARRLATQQGFSFRDTARLFLEAHESSWKNAKHAAQWSSTLKRYVFPTIGALPVSAITVEHVLKILEPIWKVIPETASRVRGRLEAILDYAHARGFRTGENPARLRGNLSHLLSARSRRVTHHAAMAYADLPKFMKALRARTSISARCLEFVILTACRTSEATGARWSEVNLAGRLWVIPADRMKAGKEHRVPLTGRAVSLLRKLPREQGGDMVFVGSRAHRPLSNMAMLMLLRGMRPNITVHGFRSSFRTWAAEKTNFPREVVEAALAHVVKSKVERAYQRGDIFEKRRELMTAWAKFCAA